MKKKTQTHTAVRRMVSSATYFPLLLLKYIHYISTGTVKLWQIFKSQHCVPTVGWMIKCSDELRLQNWVLLCSGFEPCFVCLFVFLLCWDLLFNTTISGFCFSEFFLTWRPNIFWLQIAVTLFVLCQMSYKYPAGYI